MLCKYAITDQDAVCALPHDINRHFRRLKHQWLSRPLSGQVKVKVKVLGTST